MTTPQVDYVADWTKRLRGRLYQQFRGLPNIEAVVVAVGRQFQALEESGQSLLSITSIDDSEGLQLRNLGRLVGQAWGGEDDATFRLYVKARVAALRSSGTNDEIYRVFFAFFGGAGNVTMVILAEFDAATLVLRIATPMSAKAARVAAGFLREAKDAGVRANLEFQPAADADTFACDGPDAGAGFGSHTDSSIGGRLAGVFPAD